MCKPLFFPRRRRREEHGLHVHVHDQAVLLYCSDRMLDLIIIKTFTITEKQFSSL